MKLVSMNLEFACPHPEQANETFSVCYDPEGDMMQLNGVEEVMLDIAQLEQIFGILANMQRALIQENNLTEFSK